MNKEKLREELANLCHEQWSGWMDYLFSKLTMDSYGRPVMSVADFQRWHGQTETAYENLLPGEKESDRREADRFVAIIEKHMGEEDD